jgi:hypothetical protein
VKVHVVTNTRDVQLPTFTQRRHLAQSGDVPCSQAQRTHSRSAIRWRTVELVWELFDTPTYLVDLYINTISCDSRV